MTSKNKKTIVIACAVLATDIQSAARQMGIDIGTKFIEAGLHDRPDLLQKKLQKAINDISLSKQCERIVIGYGVCGRGTVGIQARNIPLAIPKVHDCIAMFLGSDAVYQREFKRYPGTFYVSTGWYETKTEPFSQQKKIASYGDKRLHYDDILEKYGEDAAKETFRFLNTWKHNYQRAAFIETGAAVSSTPETYARKMATAYGWKFEKIKGDPHLLKQLLLAEDTTDEILVVQPDHVIVFDALESTLSANPIWIRDLEEEIRTSTILLQDDLTVERAASFMEIGLGIDAGGTYTDTVIYDMEQRKTLCKAKALTTKWDFTVGIEQALERLDQVKLQQVEMVSLSTTLATNAIVEGDGQKVGMIVMPPYGRLEQGEIPYEPKAIIQGQLEISGKEIRPVNESEVRRVAKRMLQEDQVRAFAVSGYAGAINPDHELEVKHILQEETGLVVTCGHELTSTLNFKTRAYTAMLNARIIPKLANLLLDVEKVMQKLGIFAPVVVVKGDGTLMSAAMAKQKPVETILSGPAASVAGAKHLTGLDDAIVVDMGGTTTDTAALASRSVRVCESGANVGGYQTHVKALEIRTTGFGGDSFIKWEEGKFSIGPRRVAPIAWLGHKYPGTLKALEFINSHLDQYAASTSDMQLLALNGAPVESALSPMEKTIVALLSSRPRCLEELVERTGVLFANGLGLQRLEEQNAIQRCGLTLTDVLHVTGRFLRWDRDSAELILTMFSRLTKLEIPEIAERLINMSVERLALEILKRQLDEEIEPDAIQTCPVCRTLIRNMMSGGNDQYRVQIDLKRPVVGIGAPIHFFLPKVSKVLGVETMLPEHADVANAIGAITSDVVVKQHLRIIPNQGGGFLIDGLAGVRHFEKFKDADAFARESLTRMVRDQARAAGTSSCELELRTEDNTSETADGSTIFLGRTIHATLAGQPDLLILGRTTTPSVSNSCLQ